MLITFLIVLAWAVGAIVGFEFLRWIIYLALSGLVISTYDRSRLSLLIMGFLIIVTGVSFVLHHNKEKCGSYFCVYKNVDVNSKD